MTFVKDNDAISCVGLCVCLFRSIVTMAVSVAVCEIFSAKEWCDLENRVRVRLSHWKWHHLIDRIRVPILLS